MVRILVVPERLYDLSRQMSQAANDLRHLDGYLGRALGGLDWEARQKAGVEGQVQAARGQARALAQQAEAMARFLAERATAFQKADEEGTQALGAVVEAYLRPVPTPVPTPSPSPTPQNVIEIGRHIRRILKVGDLLSPIGVATVIALSLKPGKTYAGEVIINLPDWLRHFKGLRKWREKIGLPGHFNHFKVTNLPSHMLRWGVVFSVPTIVKKGIRDIGEYSGTKLFSAIVVDAGLTLTTHALVPALTAGAVVTLAPAVLPTTVVAGSALVLGTAASVAAEWAVEHFVREKAIDTVDHLTRWTLDKAADVAHAAGETVESAVQTAGDMIARAGQKAVQAVDNALRPVAEGISKAFGKLKLGFL